VKVALDTNVLVYAEGFQDPAREAIARRVIQGLAGRLVVPVQVLGELYNVLARKAKRSKSSVRQSIARWAAVAEVAHADLAVFEDALQLATDHDLQIWDAVVLATAWAAGSSVVLSEDMHHDFTWKSVTVVNPFMDPRHPLLKSALSTS
jgi:predicted nucleic acid-binding protein